MQIYLQIMSEIDLSDLESHPNFDKFMNTQSNGTKRKIASAQHIFSQLVDMAMEIEVKTETKKACPNTGGSTGSRCVVYLYVAPPVFYLEAEEEKQAEQQTPYPEHDICMSSVQRQNECAPCLIGSK